MKPQAVLTVEIAGVDTTGPVEGFGPSSRQFGSKSAGMVLGQVSLGGILVVDDEPANRKLLRLILEAAGYDILEAEDGQEAINVLSGGENPMTVDLILTDLNMPRVDGFEAIAFFQNEYPGIPVIVLTGIGHREAETSFRRQGVSDYLVKPVDVRILIASVTNAIAQRQLSCA